MACRFSTNPITGKTYYHGFSDEEERRFRLLDEVYDSLTNIQAHGDYTQEEMEQAFEYFKVHCFEDEQ